MLGRYVRVKVTAPIFSTNELINIKYNLNFGEIDFVTSKYREKLKAYIMGINHPVKTFDGRIIASISLNDEKIYVVAPKSKRYIAHEIMKAMEFVLKGKEYTMECLYELSCGAVVFRIINGETRYLIIKNKRSAHWSFPKGHVEEGETLEETAKREVLEETGISIEFIPNFKSESEYTIQGRVEKTVQIYLATTNDTQTIIQKDEIEDYIWLNFGNAYNKLKFENDKKILTQANDFLLKSDLLNAINK